MMGPTSDQIDDLYDPLNPPQGLDSVALLAAARRTCPVYQTNPGMFVATRYDDVQNVLADHATFSNVGNFSVGEGAGAESLPTPFITMIDPPDHTILRNRLKKWFAPNVIRSQEPRIRKIVTEMLDEYESGETVEFFSAVARRLPARTVYAFIGLPEQDWEQIQAWADAVNDALPEVPPNMPEMGALGAYVGKLVADRMAQEKSEADILDGLCHPGDGETALTVPEVATHTMQLIFAGTDTTAGLITNLFYELLVDRSRWERLLNDPSLVPWAIEESLRHDPPLGFSLRTATEDVQLGGCPVAAGDRVVVNLQSAGADESVWDSAAAEYDLDRRPASAIMAFGFGIHTCLGAPLARLEARVVLSELLARFPHLRLADGYNHTITEDGMVRRPDRLDVVM